MTPTNEDPAEVRRLQALDAISLLANRLGTSAPQVAFAITGARRTWTEMLKAKRPLRFIAFSQVMQSVSALWPPKYEWPTHLPRLEADISMIERPDVLIDKDEEEPSTETQGEAA